MCGACLLEGQFGGPALAVVSTCSSTHDVRACTSNGRGSPAPFEDLSLPNLAEQTGSKTAGSGHVGSTRVGELMAMTCKVHLHVMDRSLNTTLQCPVMPCPTQKPASFRGLGRAGATLQGRGRRDQSEKAPRESHRVAATLRHEWPLFLHRLLGWRGCVQPAIRSCLRFWKMAPNKSIENTW